MGAGFEEIEESGGGDDESISPDDNGRFSLHCCEQTVDPEHDWVLTHAD